MEIQRVSISKINPAVYNPRLDLQPGDPDYEKLKQSISSFGLVEPLVWNKRTGSLVGGHQRLKILIAAGFKEIEVSVVDLDIEKEKALNLALNKIQGDWDEEKLAVLLDELSKVPDFDVALTGFDREEMSELFDRHREILEDDGYDAVGDAESIDEPITKVGEIIELGPHRIICGDSSKLETLKALFGDKKANLFHGDFPYNVSYGQKGGRPSPDTRPKKSRDWKKIYNDDMPQKEYEAWMREILENTKNFLYPGAPVYAWQGTRQFPPMSQIMLDLGFHVSCVIMWLKESAAITYADYSFASEQCLYGWLGGAAHFWAGEPGQSNVWDVKRDPTQSYIHPTQKPVSLPQRAIKNSSKREDIVLDTFLGSGSTLIAADTLDRRCFGAELDPAYCDAIVRRYINYAGHHKVSKEVLDKYGKEVKSGRK